MTAFRAPLKIFKLSRPLKRPRRNGRRRSLSALVVTTYSLTLAFTNTTVSMINNKSAMSNVYSAKPVNANCRE